MRWVASGCGGWRWTLAGTGTGAGTWLYTQRATAMVALVEPKFTGVTAPFRFRTAPRPPSAGTSRWRSGDRPPITTGGPTPQWLGTPALAGTVYNRRDRRTGESGSPAQSADMVGKVISHDEILEKLGEGGPPPLRLRRAELRRGLAVAKERTR
jgi:hypothetical protein